MSRPPRNPVVDGKKKCWRCKKILPVEDFYVGKARSGNTYLTSYCRDCLKKLSRQHFRKNRKRYLAKNREWRDKNRERFDFLMWRSMIMRVYKLTAEEYDRLAGDPPRCGICGCERTQKRRLSVDHLHGTTIVRGILCVLCNRALERLETIADWCSKAQSYLAKAQES
jgi:Recombination endonuclease VII